MGYQQPVVLLGILLLQVIETCLVQFLEVDAVGIFLTLGRNDGVNIGEVAVDGLARRVDRLVAELLASYLVDDKQVAVASVASLLLEVDAVHHGSHLVMRHDVGVNRLDNFLV